MRWLLLLAILLFITAQIVRLRPSARDKQLQRLRQAASRAGLLVRFWTPRSGGHTLYQLPESGFCYWLPWPPESRHDVSSWSCWLNARGESRPLAGQVPAEAGEFLQEFRRRFADGWALLECSASGIGLVWQERGTEEDVTALAAGLERLRNRMGALPG